MNGYRSKRDEQAARVVLDDAHGGHHDTSLNRQAFWSLAQDLNEITGHGISFSYVWFG